MITVDSSIIIGLLNGEPGSATWLGDPEEEYAISAVNLQEVFVKGLAEEIDLEWVQKSVERLQLRVIPHDGEQAREAAALWPVGRSHGLSLGDRSCLALARKLGTTVLTADRVWAKLDIGIDIRLVR